MNTYSLVRFFFGGVCKPISRQPAIAERSPNLESDGLEPVSALILGRLLHHFEPFFFFNPENWVWESLPYLSWHYCKGKKQNEKKSLYNCSENHKAPYKCKFITIKNLWHSFQGKSSHHSSFFFFKGRNLYYPLTLLGYSVVQPTFIPHGRDQLEVFLVENEMHSPGARVGVGDALLIKGVSQGFRSTEEDSYSGTFGKKQRKKKTVLGFGMGSITKHMGRFPTDFRPQSRVSSAPLSFHKWQSSGDPWKGGLVLFIEAAGYFKRQMTLLKKKMTFKQDLWKLLPQRKWWWICESVVYFLSGLCVLKHSSMFFKKIIFDHNMGHVRA